MAFFYKYEYTNKTKNIHPWLRMLGTCTRKAELANTEEFLAILFLNFLKDGPRFTRAPPWRPAPMW